MRAALLTISTSKAAGEGHDESGERLAAFAARLGAEIAGTEILSDDRALIEARLRHFSDEAGCDLVLTSGGTGFAPSDVTPEATRAAIEREAPGIAEAMRAASRPHSPHWMLSRGLAGIRGRTLIVNFPGSPASIEQAGEAIAAALPHALDLLAGRPAPHSGAAATKGGAGTSKDDAAASEGGVGAIENGVAASGSGAIGSEPDPARVASRE